MIRSALAALAALFPMMAGAFEVHDVAPGIWAIEGPSEQRSPENLGNNATFGLIETSDGAVLIDPGGSFNGAAALDAIVARLTDQPVTTVINTGGQDHRWLGNAYWQARGATVIASAAATADQQARASLQMTMLRTLVGAPSMAGTEPAHADIVFASMHDFEQGGRHIEIIHTAPAHTPGDSFVWLPESRVVFSGDIVFVGRLLGVLDISDTAGWIEAFRAIEALDPLHVVPGHGPATTLDAARADTLAYLENLRAVIRDHIDTGGDIIGSVDVDQSGFAHLVQFDALARRNAQAAFTQMEWE